MRHATVAIATAAALLTGLVAAGCGADVEPSARGARVDRPAAIVVERPRPGERVASPVRVSGSANVFEANVTVRILDAGGVELARTFTTASCGTGCWGTFSLAARYRVGTEQDGTIVVQDDDAAGVGKPPHEVRIPVVLTPDA